MWLRGPVIFATVHRPRDSNSLKKQLHGAPFRRREIHILCTAGIGAKRRTTYEESRRTR